MKPTPQRRFLLPLTLASILFVSMAALAAATASSYGYVRTLDGRATHLGSDGRESTPLDSGQPLLTGDRVEVGSGSHAELVLADQTIVRLDGSTVVSLDALAESGDRDAAATRVGLDRGNLQVVVAGGSAQPPRIDTANASVYFLAPGSYRISTDGDWTLVVVRDGSAEVRTARDSRQLGADQALEVQGDESSPQLAERDAGPEDALERWGQRLEERASEARVTDVDPSLRYAAAPLEGHGAWVSVGGRRAWQPWVGSGWRPYWDGNWSYTPSGLTWVSSEPWGWVTYHYGTWDMAPGYGWVWYPGATYAPAWVYWYWGPSYVGWCPIGYYTRYYSAGLSLDFGFRFGIHGWAGGRWDGFLDWNFVPIDFVRSPHLRSYCQRGFDLRASRRLDVLPRGVITTDTRIVTRERWSRPREVVGDLERNAVATRPGGRVGGALPDVNDFVARRRDISPGLRQIAMPVDSSAANGREPVSGMRRAVPPAVGSRPGAGSEVNSPAWRSDGNRPGARIDVTRPGLERPGHERPGLDRPRLEPTESQPRSYRNTVPRTIGSGGGVSDAPWRGGGRVATPPTVRPGSGLRTVEPGQRNVQPRSSVGDNGGNPSWRTVAPRTVEPGQRNVQPRSSVGDNGGNPSWRTVAPRTTQPGYRTNPSYPSYPSSPAGPGSLRDYRSRPVDNGGVSRESTPIRRIVDSARRPGGEAAQSYRPPTSAPRSYVPSAPSGGVSGRPGGGSSGSRPSGGSGGATGTRPSSHHQGSGQSEGGHHKPPTD